MGCDLCEEGVETHPDDYIRVVVVSTDYSRPLYVCADCLAEVQTCNRCRWYTNGHCFQTPFTVAKKPKERCGSWKQDRPIKVIELERGSSIKFKLA